MLRILAVALLLAAALPAQTFSDVLPAPVSDHPAAVALERAFARAIDAVCSADLETAAFFADQVFADQDTPQPPAKPPQGPPSLGDLGFPPSQTQGNAQEQARLDRRTHMLKIHQRLGLITTIPLLATVISGSFAGGKSTSSTPRDLHAALGSVTGGLYFSTAYFAIFAPKIPGTQTRGQIRLHKALAWIHGPGMVLTPILGAMAFDQKANGEKIHGIASAHGAVAYVTAAAFGLAVLSVSFKF
jgi:hypothetical protein